MKLPPFPFVVLDTETTGFVPRVHRVFEFASVRAKEGEITDRYEQLFSVPDIPPHVEVLTHTKTEDVRGKPPIKEHADEILKHIGKDTLIVGQNVLFDLGMLRGEGIDLTDRPWVDTSMLASLVFPELASYSLGYLSEVLDLTHEPIHRAMGDVLATLELLAACWERFTTLPAEHREVARSIVDRGPEGYRIFFHALPKSTRTQPPKWLRPVKASAQCQTKKQEFSLPLPEKGAVHIVEESLDPCTLRQIIDATVEDKSIRHWIAVKNLDATIERMCTEYQVERAAVHERADARILYPPHMLLDPETVRTFAEQKTYTADETTLALKISWYEPRTRGDFPLHGSGEESVWFAKLAATDTSPVYRKQFENLPTAVILDHRQLLRFIADEDHIGKQALAGAASHVIIDDASMLEDTATKAYGWFVAMDDLRAAAEGFRNLTKFVDVFELWIEKTRQFQPLHMLTVADLKSPDAHGIRKQLATLFEDKTLSDQTMRQLTNLEHILDSDALPERVVWLEQRQSGSHTLHSAPERVGKLLEQHLYSLFPTTLLVPGGCAEILPELLPPSQECRCLGSIFAAYKFPLTFTTDGKKLDDILEEPPPGKTILLIPSKGTIENMFVKYDVALEKKGVAMISQGLSGGQGRMQAEFVAAEAPAIWLLTPWFYEGIELPPGTVDHLILATLPFDHPSYPVLARRKGHYKDGFSDYCVPRVLHRLFRLLRTYARHRTEQGDAAILDDRLFSKDYGERVREYLSQFAGEPVTTKEARPRVGGKVSKDQMPLF